MFMLSVLQPQPEGGSWDMQNCGPDLFGSEWIEITCEFPEGIQTVSVLVYVAIPCVSCKPVMKLGTRKAGSSSIWIAALKVKCKVV